MWQHLYFEGRFKFNYKGQELVMSNFNSSFETSIFWTGTFVDEQVSLELWHALSEKATTIVDIGANTGIYSLVASKTNKEAAVIAFEPIPRIFNRLRLNVEANALNVVMVEGAASDQTGEAVIYDLPVDHHYHASLVKDEVIHHENVSELIIQTTRFDDYRKANSLKDVDLVKIDVEGFELPVINGMHDTISECTPTFLIELKNGDRARDIQKVFDELGYSYYNIDENNGVIRTDVLGASTKWNYLLLSPRHRDFKLAPFLAKTSS